ncbi:MAG: DUF1295 domain-containing protein [Stenotrophobium sp.]
MNKTALFLIAALILVAIYAFKFDQALTPEQWLLLRGVSLLMLAIAAACFTVGEFTGNLSQVDKIWSITPPVFAWYLTVQGGMDERMVLMSALATVWGVRLTYNFSRHGAYQWKFWGGAEDYRWAHVRSKPELQGRLKMTLFNLFFISLYQNALLLLITLPILLAHGAKNPLGWIDYAMAAVFLGLVTYEAVADQQQRVFQNEKHRRTRTGEKLDGRYARGFISSGLWSLSRHPNYLAEQSIWAVFFLFSIAATGRFNWSAAGCLLLILLFQGSSNLAESISSGKYPEYQDYQKRVPRFIPRLF